MGKIKALYIIIFSLCYFFSGAQSTTINYQNSGADFPNPERGFYHYSIAYASNYTVLDVPTLSSYRDLHQVNSDPNFQIYSTLVFRYYVLDDFKQSDISQSFLDNMQIDFDAARSAGVKLIPRFSYVNAPNTIGCTNWICPPYGDASKAWVLSHIAQLGPVLQTNKDVISAVQMGLVGVWGENYYTDYFGDASISPYKLTNANWDDRNEVLQALLDAVPDDRMVQVRYPQLKQRFVYGVDAPTNSAALNLSEAFSQTDKARIGFHNDCLLASYTDFGTFNDYGNDNTSSVADTTNLKPYKEEDSKYSVVGGETCFGNDPFDNCSGSDPDARADTELRRFHYSYLNSDYNYPDVNVDWVGDCMEEIKKELGYRFVLDKAVLSDQAEPGQTIDISIEIDNEGYATPFNPRGAELILRHMVSQKVWTVALDSDPRYWFSRDTISESLCIPYGMPAGDYEYLLNLPDPDLADRAEYSIRLANLLSDNSDVWESTTGYNKLGHTLTISTDGSFAGNACGTENSFSHPDLCLELDVNLWLEGTYDTQTASMTTALYDLGILPDGQSYNQAPWNYTGTEGQGWINSDYPLNTVDWLLVSLRTDIDPSTEIYQGAALLLNDGTLMLPGECILASSLEEAEYYVLIQHRNHMGVMSAQEVLVNANRLSYHFPDQDSYHTAVSTGQKELSLGIWVLLAGDFDPTDVPSYDINGADKEIWLQENGSFNLYKIPDANLNGDINGEDKVYWQENSGNFSGVPK